MPEEADTAGGDDSGVACAGAEPAGAETVGAETAGAEAAGAETAGAVGIVATGGAGCFRVKKKIAANTMITAAEMTISVVEFSFIGCFGSDDGGVNLAVVTNGSSVTVADGVGSCASGGMVRTLPRGAILSGTLLGETTPVGTFPGGIGLGGTELGATSLCGIWLWGTLLGVTPLGGASLDAIGAAGMFSTGTWLGLT